MTKKRKTTLKSWCKKNKLTYGKLASRLGVPIPTISNIANRLSNDATAIYLIHKATGIPMESLLPIHKTKLIKNAKIFEQNKVTGLSVISTHDLTLDHKQYTKLTLFNVINVTDDFAYIKSLANNEHYVPISLFNKYFREYRHQGRDYRPKSGNELL